MKLLSFREVLFTVAFIFLTSIACSHSDVNTSTFNRIVPENSKIEKTTAGYDFDTAGSPLFIDGNLYYTNNNFDSPGELSQTFRMNSSGIVDTLIVGNNVMTTLKSSGKGTIYACEMLGHRVVELDLDGNVLRVMAEAFNGNRIDGPNDLVVDNKGGFYFSDSQFIAGREIIQPRPAVYYVSADGEISRVIDDIAFPNGLAISTDNQTLYVANTQGHHILAYDISKDGIISSGYNFAEILLAEGSEIGGADGIAVDKEGNMYVATTQGLGVQIFDKSGNHLGNIDVPSPANNVSFGGQNMNTLYISAEDGIYQILLDVEGR